MIFLTKWIFKTSETNTTKQTDPQSIGSKVLRMDTILTWLIIF